MGKITNDLKTNFTKIPNIAIVDHNLTDSDFRLLIYLYSLPNGWNINQEQIGRVLNCSRKNVCLKISRLKKYGYLEIIKNGNDYDYHFPIPLSVTKNGIPKNGITENGIPKIETYNNTIYNNTNINNKKDNIYNAEIEEIINYMNQDVLKESNIYGTITFSYKTTTPKTRSLIIARLKEGYTVDDFKDVIFLKYQDWVMDEKNSKQMRKYYRPETLFGNKFENYLQEYKTLE